MQFKFPDHKVDSRVWFLSDTDRMSFGKVDMITIVIKEGGDVSIWYGIVDETGKAHTTKESQILDNQTQLKQPKFNVGEEVAYEFKDSDDRTHYDTGVISNIQIYIEEGVQAVRYVFEDNMEYWASESEILCLADTANVSVAE